MRQFLVVLIGCTMAAALCGCRSSTPTNHHLFSGLDVYERDIATPSVEAQQFFNQGLLCSYGFNHAEAIRSYEQAAALDPDNPMPWWGIAHAHGMNINDPVMTKERYRDAHAAATEAVTRLSGAPARDAALVRAVEQRYSWPPPAEQRDLDQAYADAMQSVYAQYPDDPDVATLYAESLMNLQPWDYWVDDGSPKGRILEVINVLERAMAAHPDHPGTAHLYIHAVEASSDPYRALAAAQVLEDRVPGAGHLIHMPSHIYVRTGRYPEAADINVRAVAADRAYFNQGGEAGFYGVYFAHNLHFLAYASMMEGRYGAALQAARELERDMDEDVLRAFAGIIEGIMPTTFHVMVRFGKWEDILREPARADYRLVSNAVRRYARGVAYAATDRPDQARRELIAFRRAAAAIPEDWWVFNNKVDTVLPIADHLLEAEIAFREGKHDHAFVLLRDAVAMEDALVYDEPPAWMLPIRHSLGALLMSAGRYAEAEAVYREDLERNPGNGWSILGLRQALDMQNRNEAEQDELRAQLASAWRRSDTRVTASCMCEPASRWSAAATR